jgi:hypothetical protein
MTDKLTRTPNDKLATLIEPLDVDDTIVDALEGFTTHYSLLGKGISPEKARDLLAEHVKHTLTSVDATPPKDLIDQLSGGV